MVYLYNTKIIPEDLLALFCYYQDDIIKNSLNSTKNSLRESSEDYILEAITNKKITEKTFSELLFHYIDSSGLTDVQVYKKAFIDKRIFSKIRSNKNYHPSFGTIVLFSLALKLTTSQFEDLLHSATYSLPQNSYVNITLKYCFDNKIYDIDRVNELIYAVSNKEIRDLQWKYVDWHNLLNELFIVAILKYYF